MVTKSTAATDDFEQAEARRGMLRAMEAFAHLMITKFGITAPQACDMTRVAFARAGRALVPDLPNGEVNSSRVADMTGLRRQDVATLLGQEDKEDSKVLSWRHNRLRIQALMDVWPTNPDGALAILPLRGARGSFEALVRRHLASNRFEAFLEILLDAEEKAARLLDEPDGARVQLLRRRFATGRVDATRIADIADHIRTICDNAAKSEDKAFFNARIESQLLDTHPNTWGMLAQNIANRGKAFQESVQLELNDPVYRSKKRKRGKKLACIVYVADVSEKNAEYEGPGRSASHQQVRAVRRTSKRSSRRRPRD
jgi:hypothetical protein